MLRQGGFLNHLEAAVDAALAPVPPEEFDGTNRLLEAATLLLNTGNSIDSMHHCTETATNQLQPMLLMMMIIVAMKMMMIQQQQPIQQQPLFNKHVLDHNNVAIKVDCRLIFDALDSNPTEII